MFACGTNWWVPNGDVELCQAQDPNPPRICKITLYDNDFWSNDHQEVNCTAGTSTTINLNSDLSSDLKKIGVEPTGCVCTFKLYDGTTLVHTTAAVTGIGEVIIPGGLDYNKVVAECK